MYVIFLLHHFLYLRADFFFVYVSNNVLHNTVQILRSNVIGKALQHNTIQKAWVVVDVNILIEHIFKKIALQKYHSIYSASRNAPFIGKISSVR